MILVNTKNVESKLQRDLKLGITDVTSELRFLFSTSIFGLVLENVKPDN